MNERQIKERIKHLKKEIEVLQNVLNYDIPSVDGRPKGSTSYTDRQMRFMEDHRDLPMKRLVKAYNHEFKTNIPEESRALYNFMIRNGIIKVSNERENYKVSPESRKKAAETRRKNTLKKIGLEVEDDSEED